MSRKGERGSRSLPYRRVGVASRLVVEAAFVVLLVGGEAALGLHDQAAAQVPPGCAEVIHQVLP